MTSGLFRLSDINECTISVDNCDANAFCNNTDDLLTASAVQGTLEMEHHAPVNLVQVI